MLRVKLDAYLDEVMAPPSSSLSTTRPVTPVEFWSAKRTTFGEIATYALNILTVPASSAAIERVFSLASIVQGGRRYRLGAENTEKEFMIKVNRNFFMNALPGAPNFRVCDAYVRNKNSDQITSLSGALLKRCVLHKL